MEKYLKRLETIDTDVYKKIAFSQLISVTFGNDDNVWNSFLEMDMAANNVSRESEIFEDILKFEIELYSH